MGHPECVKYLIHLFAVSNLEEELTKLAGKDGWIKVQEFMRFAYGTELCKVSHKFIMVITIKS